MQGKGVEFFKQFLLESENILIIIDCSKYQEENKFTRHLKALSQILSPKFTIAITCQGFHIAKKTFETLAYEGTLYYDTINFFRYSLEDKSFSIIHGNYDTSKFINANVKTPLKLTTLKEAFEYVDKKK
ncbi:MAG: hypothetical protein RR645_02135 [Clostridium sp.]